MPSKIANELKLEGGEEVVLEVRRAGVGEAFGSLRDWDVEPQKLKAELRRGW